MKIWKNTNILDKYINKFDFINGKNIAEIALLGSKSINLDDFPNLKIIFRAGVGLDNVPINDAQNRGIDIVLPSEKTQNIIFEETANHTCYLILHSIFKQSGSISPWRINFREKAIQDIKLLIIGCGNIGGKVIEKMGKFCSVTTFDIIENSQDQLDELIMNADIISIHIPLIPENIKYFNKEKLAKMKDGAILINTSRAGLVCEDALYNEIQNGRIKAAFDVFWNKPYSGKLKDFYPDRFFMTPHVASKCIKFIQMTAADFIEMIERIAP